VALQLDQQHIEAEPGRRYPEGCPYRCLPDPALPGDDEDARCSEEVSSNHWSRA
jgi:hypothetical protein